MTEVADDKKPDHAAMNPEQFRHWRKSLGLKQKDAADRLGLKKRMIQYYEKGDRDGRPVEIPRSVRLACFAISQGVHDFDGRSAHTADAAGDMEGRPAHPDRQNGRAAPRVSKRAD